ncbi:MAG: site-2 protease family protein [Chloroflexota bacterium]
MGRSLRIATVRGIGIRLHITFPLIVAWAAVSWGTAFGMGWRGAAYGILLVLLLFVCVVLHELGHSLVAMRFGIQVKDITLLPIGGVAQMRRMPSKPWQELLVAAAGPAVNVAIAALLGGLFWLTRPEFLLPAPFQLLRTALHLSPRGVVLYLLAANLSMAVFNLLPAFPMDGGRIFRALLAMRLGHMRATIIAARTGQVLAVGAVALSMYLYSPMVALVGVFVFTSAGGELGVARMRSYLGAITASQAVTGGHAPLLSARQTLGSVTSLAVFNHEPNFPVVDEQGRLVGLLRMSALNEALREYGPWGTVGEAMWTGFRSARPSDSLMDVQDLMAETELDAVPVTDDQGYQGVLTRERIGQLLQVMPRQKISLGSR